MKAERAYLALALLGLCAAGFLVSAAVLATATGPQNAALAPAAALCAIAFLVPGVAFFSMWRRIRIRELGLSQVGALLQSYRVVRIREMAEKLRKSEEDTEQIIALAIAAGYARGRVDARNGWFIADGAPDELVRERTGGA